MTRLGDLIDAASRANSGRSMQAAADLATERGAPISKSHISKNSRDIETITPQLIRGIAAGYDLPEDDVARAALEDLGFVIYDYQLSPESAIRRDPTLSSEARAMLLAAIGAARTVPLGATKGKRNVVETTQEPDASTEAVEGQEALSPDGKDVVREIITAGLNDEFEDENHGAKFLGRPRARRGKVAGDGDPPP